MYNKPMLSLDQTEKAMQAMIQKATQEPDRPVARSRREDGGNQVSDGERDKHRPTPQAVAIRKAYTSARSGQNSADYAERLKSQGRTVSDFGNPNLVSAQGAAVVLDPASGAILGAIGVSGLSSQEDEDLAKLGVQALGV